MNSIKLMMIFCLIGLFSQFGISQEDRSCEKKMQSVMGEFEKRMQANPDVNREESINILNDLMAEAKKRYPECFSDEIKQHLSELKEEAKEEDQKVAQNLKAEKVEFEKKQEERLRDRESEDVKRTKELENYLEPTYVERIKNRKNPKRRKIHKIPPSSASPEDPEVVAYRAFRKECFVELNPLIKELQVKGRANLELAKTPADQKAVRDAFSKAKSKILDECARGKMDARE